MMFALAALAENLNARTGGRPATNVLRPEQAFIKVCKRLQFAPVRAGHTHEQTRYGSSER